jgi:hypothetical protein
MSPFDDANFCFPVQPGLLANDRVKLTLMTVGIPLIMNLNPANHYKAYSSCLGLFPCHLRPP